MTTKAFGASIKRKEDPRLITGEAKYLDDLQMPGLLHAAILRSTYAHAKIKSIDTSKAAAAPGVVGVFTGKDFMNINPLPIAWQAGGVKNFVNSPRVLEVDKVTHSGAGIAVVVATDRYIAEDALRMIEVEWEPLPVVVDAKKATQPGVVQIHENAPNNIVMDWNCGDLAATEKALAASDVVVKQSITNQRLIPNPIETRGCMAQYNPASEEYTVWVTSQAPHVMRLLMTAFVFGINETKMRVISPQIGGGFGSKDFPIPGILPDGCPGQEAGRARQMDGDPQ